MPSGLTLRFPFELSPGRKILGLNEPVEQTLDKLTFRFERRGHLHILEVHSFESEATAKEFANRIWAGLMWVTLNSDIAFSINTELDKIYYPDSLEKASTKDSWAFGSPIEDNVEGVADGNLPAVYPSDKMIRFAPVGEMNAAIGTPLEQVSAQMIEGISISKSSNITSDSKFRTALELYNAHYYDRSAAARLLTLVMALETLTTGSLKPQFVIDILAQWQQQIEELKSQLQPKTEEHKALEALERELLSRREKSLRSQIRALVQDTLEKSGLQNASEFAQNAVKVYDKRSTLVREGSLPNDELRWAEAEAKQIVEAVLKAKFVMVGKKGANK